MKLGQIVVCFLAISMFGTMGLAQSNGQEFVSSAMTVPRLIRIQGSVHDEAGKPLSGRVGITFSLYRDQTEPTPIWQETQTVELESTGRYSALLGVTNEAGLPLEIFSAGEARWLGIRPDAQTEQPRILFLSVAYALKAADSDMLGGRPASAFVLANSQSVEATSGKEGAHSQMRSASVTGSGTLPMLVSPNTACSVTSDGTASANQLAKFTTACNIQNSAIFESGGNVGIGTSTPAGMLDVTGSSFFRNALNVLGGIVMPPVQTATTKVAYASNPVDLEASAYNTAAPGPVTYLFRWQADPVANNTANAAATLNLLYGVNGLINQTGLSINGNGILAFAPGQTFPGAGGAGTVTNVATGAGLTGGPITSSGTISIPSAGVTNAMLANNSVTVKAGTGLTGGGAVALGGAVTLSSTATGTVTSVATGTGLTGGPITSAGTLSLNTTFTDGRYLQLSGGALTGGLAGTTAAFTTGTFTGALTAAGTVLPITGTATASKGFNSNPFDLQASSFSSSTSKAVAQDFRWVAEPTGNNSASPSGTLNLQFGANGAAPTETGLSIASNGRITFAAGQTFPGAGGSGTVTSVSTGAGLTGGPITSSGTISIPAAGVTNAMLVNPSITVQAGSGLSGGGTVALGGTITLTNAAPGSGGTVTSVASGTGLTGGPITGSGTLSLNTAYTDGRYLQLSGGALTGGLTGTTASFTGALGAGTGSFTGAISAAGAVMPNTGTATATKGFNSNPFDLQASSFSSGTSKAVAQDFRWIVESAGNNSANPTGTLNLLFGANGASPAETGFSIASNGLVTFASGQTFPGSAGSGTVTSVSTGAGLTGGPITSTGTISIPAAGVTNTMLANTSITVQAGSGLSGGGTVALGGTITLTNTASGGTVTSVGSGTGLTGGPITGSGTLKLDTTFTDARYLQLGGGVLTGPLTATSAAFTAGLSSTTGTFTGSVQAGGDVLPQTGAATASQGFNSNPLDLQASAFSSASSSPVSQNFRWIAEPSGNNSSNPSGSLNLLFGSNGASPAETGFSIASNGVVTFASGQTFPGGNGTGTVTTVNTGAGLTGGPITSSGTISIPAAGVLNSMLANPLVTIQAGSGLSGGGTVALGGTVTLSSNLSGSSNGVAYFSSPTTLTSTPAPTDGQILIGSTGNAPVPATLTAGPNVTITNSPGAITISAAGGGGGAPTLPFFVTAGARNGAVQTATLNVNKLWGFLLPYNVTTTAVTYDVTTADNTANDYDIGIFNSAGALVVDIGPTPGTIFAPTKVFHSVNWIQGATSLPAGKYYIGLTTNCKATCAAIAAVGSYISFAINVSAGATAGGALSSMVTVPADTWGAGNQPLFVIQ